MGKARIVTLSVILCLTQSCFPGPPPAEFPIQPITASVAESKTESEDIPEYNRSDWGSWEIVGCKSTRTRVLESESEIPVIWKDDKECEIELGKWVDWYTGQYYTDPSQLDIDHLVPLKEAHDSGAWSWSKERKKGYFNYLEDPNHLIAVYAPANKSKGDRGPEEWLPVEDTYGVPYRCTYIKNWVKVKEKWGLEVDYKTITHLMMEHCEPRLFREIYSKLP